MAMLFAVATLLTGCLVAGAFEVPDSLLERASPLTDASAKDIKEEILETGSVSNEHCKQAGLLCGSARSYGHSTRSYGHSTLAQRALSASGEEARVSSLGTTVHHHHHRHSIGVFFFRRASLEIGHRMVLPPLTTGSFQQQSVKFVHPSLQGLLGEMALPQLLSTLHIPPNSDLANEIEANHRMCKSYEGVAGESKSCITSLKAMEEFVASVLATPVDKIKQMDSSRPQSTFETFTVVDTAMVPTKALVSCHSLTYPFALYMCHDIPKSQLLKVTLQDHEGKPLVVPVICHTDTSSFSSSHIAFKMLDAKPGEGEICHWLPNSHYPWYSV